MRRPRGCATAAAQVERAVASRESANAGSNSSNSRAPCAATAATLRVAAVDGRCQRAHLRVGRGQERQAGPALVVDLVVHHAGVLTGRRDHLLHPLELPARLVQHVGHVVAVLRQVERAVAERTRRGRGRGQGPLVGAEQLRHGDAAVDHVLAVVARVVPAARDVERVVAGPAVVVVARPDAGHLGVALVGCDADVTGHAGVLLADDRAVDRRCRSGRGRSSRARPGAAAGTGPRRCRTDGSSPRRRRACSRRRAWSRRRSR